jgi:uncharacterized protein
MKQAAMATSAAPTFFEPYRIDTAQRDTPGGFYSLVDGAVYANNPTLLAVLEARMTYHREHNEELRCEDILIVSLGTGSMVRPYHYENIKEWGKFQWIQPFISMTFDGQNEAIDSQLSSFMKASGCEAHYHRFQVDLNEENNEMDNASDKSINCLMALTDRMIEQTTTSFDRLCHQLEVRSLSSVG